MAYREEEVKFNKEDLVKMGKLIHRLKPLQLEEFAVMFCPFKGDSRTDTSLLFDFDLSQLSTKKLVEISAYLLKQEKA